MAPILNIVKNTSRAAVLALALGAAALTAMPAQAQGPGQHGQGGGPATTFQLDLGNGGGNRGEAQTFGPQGQGGRVIVPDHNRPNRFCMDDRQIRRGISAYGFDNVRIRRDIGRNRVEVTGNYGRWTYSMRVDRCTGNVDRMERVRPAGNGFGFQFDFGR